MPRLDDDSLRWMVDGLVEERADVFGGFYRPVLSECSRRMRSWEATRDWADAGFVDLPRVADSTLRSVMALCHSIGVRSLISVFRARRSAAGDGAPGYDDFHAHVSSDTGRGELFEAFPELRRLLVRTSLGRVANVEEALDGAWEDRGALTDAFGVGGPITSVAPGLGDSHRGGRTVCFVTWEEGGSLVYKPQRWSCHALVEELRRIVDRDGSFFGPLYPRTVTRPERMWQEPVVHSDIGGEYGTAGYFRRFGRSAALLGMLGANDLHHENVIATAEGPVVIDTETLVSLPNQASPGPRHALHADLEASVLGTFLFPTPYRGTQLDIDLSAIGNVRPWRSGRLQSYLVVDEGTDDIRFDTLAASIGTGPNMATADGTPIDPRPWSEEIAAGFREGYERLRARRAQIDECVGRSSGWSVRQIVRPTYVYARFLEASTHPAYLRDGNDRRALFDKLPRRLRGVRAEAAEAVCAEETRALLDMDVPFYEVGCDAPDLLGNGVEEIAHAVASTPRQSALDQIDAFFSRPPERDAAYIRYALACATDDAWSERGGSGACAPPGDTDAGMLEDPGVWHARLRELVVGPASRPTWLTPSSQGSRLVLDTVDGYLHEGGGLMLHLAGAEPEQGGPLPGAAVGDVYTEAVRTPEDPGTPSAMSPFTGALARRVTGLELARLGVAPPGPLPRVGAGPLTDDGVDRLTAEDFDYLNGLSGYLVYLAEYPDPGGPRVTGAGLERLLARLVQVDGSPEENHGDLGLAHGRFGRVAAMSAVVGRSGADTECVRVHLERFADAYLRHRWTDDALRDPSARATWCKGYTGVAFALAKLLRALGHPVARIREAVAPEVARMVEGGFGSDISLCHGVAGRIAVLCWLADRLDWPELRTEAKDLDARFLDRHGGGSWTCGVGSMRDLPSFLFGLSGWYRARAVLQDPGTDLPLCFGGL